MVMKITIHGRISPRGGDDAEHPSTIPMDVTLPPQAWRGPTTRAHARDVGTEVNSFLFEFHSDSHESRVLPQMDTLCILRYQGHDHEEARRKPQATEEEEKEGERPKREATKALETPGARPSMPPGARAFGHPLGEAPEHPECQTSHLGAAAAPPGDRAIEPRVPAPYSARAQPSVWSGCPAPFAPGARTTPRACVPLWVFTLVSSSLPLFCP